MPRPRKFRKVCCLPKSMEFGPTAPAQTPAVITMSVDEYEAIRLIDKMGFSQEECGAYMHIARTTVQQIYASARKKLADAIVDGSILRIEGGNYRLCDGLEHSCGCGGCKRHAIQAQAHGKEIPSMNIIIPLDEDKKSVCIVLARAPYFLLHNTESGESTVLENPAAQAQGGAGIKAAQFIADSGADTLLTVRCGENAAEVFKAADIKIYKANEGSAEDNLAAMKNGALEELTHFHGGFHGHQ